MKSHPVSHKNGNVDPASPPAAARTTVGRGAACRIQIRNPHVSKRHAVIRNAGFFGLSVFVALLSSGAPRRVAASEQAHNLALGRAVAASSDPKAKACELVDNVMQGPNHNENFWFNSPDDARPHVTIDLGEARGIEDIKLQFRGISGRYIFVPESIGILVSSDGKRYDEILSSTHVPQEKAPYSPLLWEYDVRATSRFVRVSLGRSQTTEGDYKGTVELTEVQVWDRKAEKQACTVTLSAKKGERHIKPLHGVNSGPLTYNLTMDTSRYFKEASIPFARLHDVEYPMGSGEFVDIHCVFPDFDADPEEPASYNFTCTDAYIKAIVDAGCAVFYRLGESIDHGPIKKYIRPPRDPGKWAGICERIIRHYNEGWANGFHYNIRYWEIWNEPENGPMWTGTDEQYFELYTVTANHLKRCFPDLKIGGYASCGFYAITRPGKNGRTDHFVSYFNRFLDHISAPETRAPLDFFSWHIYNDDPGEVVKHAEYVHDVLTQRGFANTESCLNEWNYGGHGFESMRRMEAARYVGAVLCRLQDAPVDSAMYYDAQPRQRYGGMFERYTTTPSKPYYAMKAFGVLYRLGYEAEWSCDSDQVSLCAASDGRHVAAVICSGNTDELELSVGIDDLEPGKKIECYLLDETHDLTKINEYDTPRFSMDLGYNTLILLKSAE